MVQTLQDLKLMVERNNQYLRCMEHDDPFKTNFHVMAIIVVILI